LEQRGYVELIGAPSIDWLGVPLTIGDNTMGVLVAESYAEGVRYGETDKSILQFVSAQVAMAIDRKRGEERLRDSENRYRLLFESNPEAMWVYDVETLRFLAVNEAAAPLRLLAPGVPRADDPGHPPLGRAGAARGSPAARGDGRRDP